MNLKPINIVSTADCEIALLSNFAHTPFALDSTCCASVEGFIQGLKCEDPEKQLRIFLRHGFEAKRASTRKRNRIVRESNAVWLQGRQVPFPSEEYFELIKIALRAKFDQNEDARAALLGTGNRELIHETGTPEKSTTSLPASRFVAMLIELRSALQDAETARETDVQRRLLQ